MVLLAASWARSWSRCLRSLSLVSLGRLARTQERLSDEHRSQGLSPLHYIGGEGDGGQLESMTIAFGVNRDLENSTGETSVVVLRILYPTGARRSWASVRSRR